MDKTKLTLDLSSSFQVLKPRDIKKEAPEFLSFENTAKINDELFSDENKDFLA